MSTDSVAETGSSLRSRKLSKFSMPTLIDCEFKPVYASICPSISECISCHSRNCPKLRNYANTICKRLSCPAMLPDSSCRLCPSNTRDPCCLRRKECSELQDFANLYDNDLTNFLPTSLMNCCKIFPRKKRKVKLSRRTTCCDHCDPPCCCNTTPDKCQNCHVPLHGDCSDSCHNICNDFSVSRAECTQPTEAIKEFCHKPPFSPESEEDKCNAAFTAHSLPSPTENPNPISPGPVFNSTETCPCDNTDCFKEIFDGIIHRNKIYGNHFPDCSCSMCKKRKQQLDPRNSRRTCVNWSDLCQPEKSIVSKTCSDGLTSWERKQSSDINDPLHSKKYEYNCNYNHFDDCNCVLCRRRLYGDFISEKVTTQNRERCKHLWFGKTVPEDLDKASVREMLQKLRSQLGDIIACTGKKDCPCIICCKRRAYARIKPYAWLSNSTSGNGNKSLSSEQNSSSITGSEVTTENEVNSESTGFESPTIPTKLFGTKTSLRESATDDNEDGNRNNGTYFESPASENDNLYQFESPNTYEKDARKSSDPTSISTSDSNYQKTERDEFDLHQTKYSFNRFPQDDVTVADRKSSCDAANTGSTDNMCNQKPRRPFGLSVTERYLRPPASYQPCFPKYCDCLQYSEPVYCTCSCSKPIADFRENCANRKNCFHHPAHKPSSYPHAIPQASCKQRTGCLKLQNKSSSRKKSCLRDSRPGEKSNCGIKSSKSRHLNTIQKELHKMEREFGNDTVKCKIDPALTVTDYTVTTYKSGYPAPPLNAYAITSCKVDENDTPYMKLCLRQECHPSRLKYYKTHDTTGFFTQLQHRVNAWNIYQKKREEREQCERNYSEARKFSSKEKQQGKRK